MGMAPSCSTNYPTFYSMQRHFSFFSFFIFVSHSLILFIKDKFELVCKKVSNGKNFTGVVSKYVLLTILYVTTMVLFGTVDFSKKERKLKVHMQRVWLSYAKIRHLVES